MAEAISLPLQFIRQFNDGAIDADQVFDTLDAMEAYLGNARRYAGQIGVCRENLGVYVLNEATDAWVQVTGDAYTAYVVDIQEDEQEEFIVPKHTISYVTLNGLRYITPGDYTIQTEIVEEEEVTTMTWGDDELETDDELLLYYQT